MAQLLLILLLPSLFVGMSITFLHVGDYFLMRALGRLVRRYV